MLPSDTFLLPQELSKGVHLFGGRSDRRYKQGGRVVIGWLHLILNIWTLWLFSPPIDDRLDHIRYLVFYIACGVAASEVAARSRRQGVSSGALGVVK
jgi:hypothetical protein